MRNLVREGVSVRDTRTILESLAELSQTTKDVEQLTELLREKLAPHITSRLKGADGTVIALTLDPRLEELLRKSLREIATGAGGALDPEMLRNLTANAEKAVAKLAATGTPCIVAPPDLRRYVRAIFERKLPNVTVASFREVDPAVPLRVVERLSVAAS
jgi:flagellar biosynthesis protein FlhA